MDAFFDHMARHDGVASCSIARDLGLDWERENHLVERGILERAAPGVLRSTTSPATWLQRVRVAGLAPGDGVISHGAAARLHGLDGFDRYDEVDVLCRKGWWPNCPADTLTHFTRGLTDIDIVEVDAIRTLSVGATLALLAPTAGLAATAKAVDGALRLGWSIDDLRSAARRWTKRGRAGPRTLRLLLDERDGKTLPASWFQRLAKQVLGRHGVRFVDEFQIRTDDGVLLAVLDLAHPDLRIGVECQSWRWHATPEAQHRDARRKGMLRQMGWEIIDVWWRDLAAPERVLAELDHVIRSRLHPNNLSA